jgi:hypothetical protein
MPGHSFSGGYAVVGLGVVAGQYPDRSQRMIAAEAARRAIGQPVEVVDEHHPQQEFTLPKFRIVSSARS